MRRPPFDVRLELEGWSLYWARLEKLDGAEEHLSRLRERTAADLRERLAGTPPAEHPTLAALRSLFRAAGTDPTRYRPSSEALVRRLLKGDELPAIHPLVDLNNCLSVRTLAPCCVMAEEVLRPPFVLRAGRAGESYESLRGPFRLEGRPLLVDSDGPCDTPITGSERVRVRPTTERVWLVAYLPAGQPEAEEAGRALAELLEAAPVARRLDSAAV